MKWIFLALFVVLVLSRLPANDAKPAECLSCPWQVWRQQVMVGCTDTEADCRDEAARRASEGARCEPARRK
jgi:hypothetical protein